MLCVVFVFWFTLIAKQNKIYISTNLFFRVWTFYSCKSVGLKTWLFSGFGAAMVSQQPSEKGGKLAVGHYKVVFFRV